MIKNIHVAVVSYILMGFIKYVLIKALLTTTSDGVADKDNQTMRKFSHPEVIVFFILVVDSSFLPLFLYIRRKYRLRMSQGETLTDQERQYAENKIFQPILIIPALCDSIASNMQSIGLLYLDLSLSAIMTGLCTAITGIFSVVFLKRKLNFNQIFSILIITIGAVTAGLSAYFAIPESVSTASSYAILGGLLFALFADILHCTQGTVQELYLKDRNIHQFHGMGVESAMNVFIQATFILIFNFIKGNGPRGTITDTYDAILQICHNPRIPLFLVLILISSVICNYASIYSIKYLSCIHRSFLGSIRTAFIWISQVFIRYVIGSTIYGEELNYFSLLRFDGYILILAGSVLYSSKMDLKYIICGKQISSDEEVLVT